MDETLYSGFKSRSPTNFKHLTPEAQWCDVYQIENGDRAEGGERGLANIQAQALLNNSQYILNLFATLVNVVSQQTELLNFLSNRIDTTLNYHTDLLNKILNKIKGNQSTTDDPVITSTKCLSLTLGTEPLDTNSAYLQIDESINADPFLSLESGEVFYFNAGDISLQAGNVIYFFDSDTSSHSIATLPADDTLSPIETLPPIETISPIDPLDTMSADEEFDDTITDQDIDDIMHDIYGDVTIVGM